MVDVLNDPSDETSQRERRRIEKSDGESHSGRNPRGVPQPMSGGMRLERGDYGEQNRKGEHENCAFLREATVTCMSGQQGRQRSLNTRLTEQPCEAEPNVGHRCGKCGAGDCICPVVENESSCRHWNRKRRSNELSVKLCSRGSLHKMTGFQVLHEVPCPVANFRTWYA